MVYVELLIDNKKKDNKVSSFSLLENKPVIVYTISEFNKNEKVDKIIIPCHSQNKDFLQKIIKKYFKRSKKIELMDSGSNRNETIIKGCLFVSSNYKLNDDDLLLVHDASRPFVSTKIIDNIINEGLTHEVVLTGIKATDTAFEIEHQEEGPRITIYNNIFLVQTPKIFNIRKLLLLYNEMKEKKISRLWELFIITNKKIKIIEGEARNFKITTDNDLSMALGVIKSDNSNLYKKRTNWDFKNVLSVVFIILSFLSLDIGFRYLTQSSISFYATKNIAPFLFSLSYISLFTYFICKNHRKTSVRFFLIYSFFWFLALVQLLYFQIFNNLFIINDFPLIKEAFKNLGFIFSFFNKTIITFLIITIPLELFVYSFVRKNFVLEGPKKKYRKYFMTLLILLLAIVIRLGGIGYLGKKALASDGNDWNYPYNIYKTYNNSNKSLRVSGLYEYFMRDTYLSFNKKIKKNNSSLIKKVEAYQKEIVKPMMLNEETNLFENKNVIMILLESIDDWLVTEERMPTLTSLQQTGINFTNYYSPSFGSSMTINAEFSALTGLHSPERGNLSSNYLKNAYPFSLVNLFKKKDYLVNSLYYDSGVLYNRATLHKTLGFGRHYSLLDLEFSNNTMDDRELVDNKEIYKLIVPNKEDKFMTFITTFSAHGPYNNTNLMCDKEAEGDKALECIIKLSKMTDNFLKGLITRLEEDNLLEKTVLVLFTDHYAYGYPHVKSLKQTSDVNLLQKVPLIIWESEMEPKTVDTIMATFDLTPTLANLFGLDYEPKYYLGTDVFSDNHENLVYFKDHSWYDGEIYYKGDNINNYSNKEEIKKRSIAVNKKIEINEAILDLDYYRKIK